MTAGSARTAAKLPYLEGLRGLAALQVVLLHYVTAFLPGSAQRDPAAYHAAWEAMLPRLRLSFLFDGHSAVYLFFLISGAVLTPSFRRGGGLAANAVKRVVRLGLPVAAAALVAAVLLAVFPNAHRAAAALSGSAWLAMDSSGAATLPHLLREIGLDSLLLGYRESTLFTPFATRLTPMEESLDAPFWSLHFELYGSLLVLALVALQSMSRRLHAAVVAASALLFCTDPMFLFVLGHLAAPVLARHPRGRAVPASGALLIATGVAMCADKDWASVAALRRALGAVSLSAPPNLFQFQSQLGAGLLFAGVLALPAARRVLAHTAPVWLGRVSFSVYLLHFPVLFTLSCLVFIALHGHVAYIVGVGLTLAAGVAATLAAAVAFERRIDRPAVALSRRIGRTRAMDDG